MMQGVVNARNEARVRLRIRGKGKKELELDTIVDSGFNSALTVPLATASALGLVRKFRGSAKLADGSVRHFDVCPAEVFWDRAWRTVLVYAIGNELLLGMRMLAGYKLSIDVNPGGAVEIVPIP